jgi:hypothetical protein
MRTVPIHPALWAVWPAAMLWRTNWEIIPSSHVTPVLYVVLASTLGAWLIARPLTRSWARSAIAVTVLTVAFQMLGSSPLGSITNLLIALSLLVGCLLVVRIAPEPTVRLITFTLNVAGVTVLIIALSTVLMGWLRAPEPLQIDQPAIAPDVLPAERDILYVIPDRFGRSDVLAEQYEWDQGPFLSALEQRGFQVASRSAANYPRTAHSLSSAWNLEYLDDAVAAVHETDQANLTLLYPLLQDHHLGSIMRSLGYDYLHLGSWWTPTATQSAADEVLTMRGPSQFANFHIDRTILPNVYSVLTGLDRADTRERARAHARHAFTTLEQLADERGTAPRFVLAHLLVPHDPYVFEPDGSWVAPDVEAARSREENYRRQIAFVERSLLQVIDRWLDQPVEDQPIIVVQADEGPRPLALDEDPAGFRWVDATGSEQREKLGIITALHLPGEEVTIPQTLSPVNTFRLVLDSYHGTGLGLLPDRISVYTSESELYRFTDVTSTLQ